MTKFFNTPEACQWLLETAFRTMLGVPSFCSFEIEGNEDSPNSVKLYQNLNPKHTDSPVACYETGAYGNLVITYLNTQRLDQPETSHLVNVVRHLRSALRSTSCHWSEGQREAAEEAVKGAEQLLKIEALPEVEPRSMPRPHLYAIKTSKP